MIPGAIPEQLWMWSQNKLKKKSKFPSILIPAACLWPPQGSVLRSDPWLALGTLCDSGNSECEGNAFTSRITYGFSPYKLVPRCLPA